MVNDLLGEDEYGEEDDDQYQAKAKVPEEDIDFM